jgi:glycerophosphoryl diester phosphodiesterase
MRIPKVIAHRGASAYAPENTMSSFRKAMELGAQGIELDVQQSHDGHLVVIHDELLERTSSGKGWVKDKTLEELKSLDFGSWYSGSFAGEQIPTLDEVMELISSWDGLLNIEIKSGVVIYPGIEQKVADTISKFNRYDRVIVSSFNHYSLVQLRKLESRIRTGILYMAGIYEPWKYAAQVGACAIHPLFYNIRPETMPGCIENGIMVNPFTVDQPAMIEMIAKAGVDGIITNVPDVARKIIGSI